MSFDPFTAGFDLVKTALDKFFPDADTELKGKLAQATIEITNGYQIQLEQIKTNQAEAQSGNWFASSWRPLTGWIGAVALGYSSILEPILRFAAVVFFDYKGTFPAIDTDITMQILFGMLGMGAYRSYDKVKGTTKK